MTDVDVKEHKSYSIVSINVGKPAPLTYQGKEISTGINKSRVEKPLFLSFTNFEGDGQADLVNHGGRDKAICVYAYDHYPYWEKRLNKPLQVGAFGENLTVSGLLEDEVCIGDIFQLGEAIVQVCQPRYPCHKLSKKHDVADFPLQVIETGYSGFYLRVLKEGMVKPEDTLVLIEKHPAGYSVSFANQLKNEKNPSKEGLTKLIELDALAQSWCESLRKKL
ncbi:MOSC domain-containing protein [Bacillus horti]|uniref:MOSC domain-containing protein YiiM n=1 Tax=Caldalkalibacillus horti TaxID=77523 RepID=A0ABT9W1A6_9BACI|nr:MOSC domain-containing protein [Bacillus horti]MDQ0167047.1 MOSC domain-containing protein YiiM [Bacillus horti]